MTEPIIDRDVRPDGRTLGECERSYLLQLLALRRDKRWRMGAIQAAVSFGTIRQDEWEHLAEQIREGVRAPTLKPREPEPGSREWGEAMARALNEGLRRAP